MRGEGKKLTICLPVMECSPVSGYRIVDIVDKFIVIILFSISSNSIVKTELLLAKMAGHTVSVPHHVSKSKEKLNVFIVPHSHNDPGWLKTFSMYFYNNTRKIIDEVIKHLDQVRLI